MNGYITADRTANSIRLQRQLFEGSFLIIEGDIDARVYKNFIDQAKCHVVNAANKKNAVDVLAILEQDGFAGVLAIVDADFDLLDGNLPTSQNLHLTDEHDLETMILKSRALEKVLAEFGSENKIANLPMNSRIFI